MSPKQPLNQPPTTPLQLKGGRGQLTALLLPSVFAWEGPPFPMAALTWSAGMSWLVTAAVGSVTSATRVSQGLT